MSAIRWFAALAIFSSSASALALEAGAISLSHHETLQRLNIQGSATDGSQKLAAAGPVQMSFDALGRSFDLQLSPNTNLLSVAREASANGIVPYRGQLAGNDNSWARIVIANGTPTGIIRDGDELFAIEGPGNNIAGSDSTIIYRLADAVIAPGSMTCGARDVFGNAGDVYKSLVSELNAAQAPGAVSMINVGAVGDAEFFGQHANPQQAILERLSNVDGIYSAELEIQIEVPIVQVFSDAGAASYPFSDTVVAGDLLDELGVFRNGEPNQNVHGLTHLWTGKDVEGGMGNTTTVGIAYRGTVGEPQGSLVLCNNRFGAGLSEGRGSPTFDALVAAHEIGHNFGADHDGDPNRSCPSEPETFIMAPSVTGNEQFSDCSIDVMQATVAGASCVAPLPAVDVGISQDGQASTVLLSASTDINYEVSSNGTVGVNGVVADFALPSSLALDTVTTSTGTCNSGAGTVSCTLGDLTGLSNHTITLSTTPIAVGVAMVNASVTTTDTDERLVNNQDALQVTVNPAVDLVVNAPSTAPVFVDSSTTVTATLENRSTLGATNVSLSVTLAAGLQADSASWSIGTCTVAAQQVDCSASNFDAQSSSSFSVTAMALVTGSQDVTASLSSADADADPSNNSATAAVNVVTPNDGGDDDGGGGTTNPLLLLVMVLAGSLGRRYNRSFTR